MSERERVFDVVLEALSDVEFSSFDCCPNCHMARPNHKDWCSVGKAIRLVCRENNTSDWILTKDRLPEIDEPVFAMDDQGYLHILVRYYLGKSLQVFGEKASTWGKVDMGGDCYDNLNGGWHCENVFVTDVDPIAWHPFPKPPSVLDLSVD